MKTMLVGEYPMIFDRKLAASIGVSESIVLQQIHYWISKNKEKNINYKNGRYWTFNSIQEWHEEEFYFWSESTIRRIFASLEKKGLLIIDSFNRSRWDRTKWYSIDYEKLEEIVFGENYCECEEYEEELEKDSYEVVQSEERLEKGNCGVVQSEEELPQKDYRIVQDEEELSQMDYGIVQDEGESSKNEDIFNQCENILKKYKTASAQNKSHSFKIDKCSCSLETDELSQKEQSNTKDYTENSKDITKDTTQQLPNGVAVDEKEMLMDFLGDAYTEEYFKRIKELLKIKGEDSAYLQEKIEIAKSKNLISKCGYLYSAVKNDYKDIPSDIEKTLKYAYEKRNEFINSKSFDSRGNSCNGRNKNRFKNFEETVSKYTEKELEEKIRAHSIRKYGTSI